MQYGQFYQIPILTDFFVFVCAISLVRWKRRTQRQTSAPLEPSLSESCLSLTLRIAHDCAQCTEHSIIICYFVISPLGIPQYTVHRAQCTVHRAQCTVHSAQNTEHSAQYTVLSAQSTVHSIIIWYFVISPLGNAHDCGV